MKKGLSLFAAAIASPALGQTIIVDTCSGDVDINFFTGTVADLPGPDGKTSFDEALIASNNTPGRQTIHFNIPESEWLFQWLYPGRAVIDANNLRSFDEVTIDATTQTAFTGDTNPDGAEVAIFGAEIYLNAGNSTIKGFDNASINAQGPNNIIQGNTTSSVSIFDATNNLIGGTGPGEGNQGGTIKIDRSDNNIVVGNTVRRVRVWGFISDFGTGPATGNRIGGPTLAERNYITGYGTHNGEGFPGGTTVELFDTDATIVENNWIGTTPDGMSSGSNASTQGIGFSGTNTGTLITNNRIAGILGIGQGPHAQGLLFGMAIYLNGSGGDISITGNTMGLNANDEPVLGSVWGVYADNYFAGPIEGVRLGGTLPGEGNVIAGHLITGVNVENEVHALEISGNSIYANLTQGIDLNTFDLPIFGVTPNDPLDIDSGANGLQNFPELTAAASSPAGTSVQGELFSAGARDYRVELFASPECDPSGHGQGQVYLGAFEVTTDVNGHAPFDTQVSGVTPAGWVVTSTATDIAASNTSEFSACVNVSASCPADLAEPFGQLDFSDVVAFLSAFGAMEPAADLAEPFGQWDFSDVVAFLAAFGAGCP